MNLFITNLDLIYSLFSFNENPNIFWMKCEHKGLLKTFLGSFAYIQVEIGKTEKIHFESVE